MSDLSEKSILIVDDIADNISMLSEILTDYRLLAATTGAKALDLVKKKRPDLILLDIEMPEMNGFEVCSFLKQEAETKDIPIIFLTGRDDKQDTVRGFELGAADYITKPYDPAELKVRVNTQLELGDYRERMESTINQLEQSSQLLKFASAESQRQAKLLQAEKDRTEQLLRNILPTPIATELNTHGKVEPRHYPLASVLFADIVGFTRITEKLSPAEIVSELNTVFTIFDGIMDRHDLEKIKTIGDGYMAVGGIPEPDVENPIKSVQAGLDMINALAAAVKKGEKLKHPWQVRIGIHTGDLIAGLIGKHKFAYDVWGQTVNIASRMETGGSPGRVNISGITYQLVKDQFRCSSRGHIEVKNMGKMDMYFIDQA